MDLRGFDAGVVNDLFASMRAEAEAVVRLGSGTEALRETRTAFMRYRGQGHEIAVSLDNRDLDADDADTLAEAFEREYHRLFGRVIPNLSHEVMTWTLALGTGRPLPERNADPAPAGPAIPTATRSVLDTLSGQFADIPVIERAALSPGQHIAGPVLIVEDETSTYVSARFTARINGLGYIILTTDGAET